MRILIDAHMVGENETGNETYIVNLLRGYAEIDGEDEFWMATPHPDVLRGKLGNHPQFHAVNVSANSWRRLFFDLPSLARRVHADLMHVTYAMPPTAPCPTVVTVHDVSFRRHPEWFSQRDRLILRAGVGLSARQANAIVTVSQHARDEIAHFYPTRAKDTVVTLEAADPDFTDAPAEGLDGPAVEGPYVLAVGNLQPRKNLGRLIEAFALLRRNGLQHKLVIVGKAKWRDQEVYRRARECDALEAVVFSGYVTVPQLRSLYRNADVFCYPSLYEGFGLPVLEAMACGAPVVVSRESALPEVAGDAAVYVDPYSTTSIADGLRQVCTTPSLQAELRAKGLRQAGRFSWRRCAEQTLTAYRNVLSGRRAQPGSGNDSSGRPANRTERARQGSLA